MSEDHETRAKYEKIQKEWERVADLTHRKNGRGLQTLQDTINNMETVQDIFQEEGVENVA